MTKQLKGKKPVTIDDAFLKAFKFLKTLLSNDPILQYPDLTKNFIKLQTQAISPLEPSCPRAHYKTISQSVSPAEPLTTPR